MSTLTALFGIDTDDSSGRPVVFDAEMVTPTLSIEDNIDATHHHPLNYY